MRRRLRILLSEARRIVQEQGDAPQLSGPPGQGPDPQQDMSSEEDMPPPEEEDPQQNCGEGTFWNDDLQKCLPLDSQHNDLMQMADHGSYSAMMSNQRVDHVKAAVGHMDAAHSLHQAGFHRLADQHHKQAARHQKKLDKHNGCEMDSHWNADQGQCLPLEPRHLELIKRAEMSSQTARDSDDPEDHDLAHGDHKDVADALYLAGFKHLAHHHRKKSRKHADAAEMGFMDQQDQQGDDYQFMDNPGNLPPEEQDTVAQQ